MARDRWFDLDAVRVPSRNPIGVGARPTMARVNGADEHDSRGTLGPYTEAMQEAGAPPLDWWEIPTQPYKGSHYATWPEALCVRPILAMCPREVCTTCGQPRRRLTEVVQSVVTHGHYYDRDKPGDRSEPKGDVSYKGRRQGAVDVGEKPSHHQGFVRHATTLGWSDCGHGTWRRGVVLDPFAGSGTTLAVAEGLGRDSIGIDLDRRNEHLVRERVGMWLEVA